MTDVVLYEVSERIATVTLNRPEARNALSTEVVRMLPELVTRAEHDPDVDVVVLTGTDPAFCAGVDLKQLGERGQGNGDELLAGPEGDRGPFPAITKPLIGAINGVAVTGGLELALNCDFLVASERAKFGDTHARVGVMPGWGLTVLLSQAVGVRRAREMSFTGNFVGADEALRLGLVNHVVAHEDLIPFTRRLALDIVGNHQLGVRTMRQTYGRITAEDEAWEVEAAASTAWRKQTFSAAHVAEQRAAIMQRGRTQ